MRGELRGCRWRPRAYAALLLFLLTAPAAQPDPAAPDITVYGRLPHIEQVALSGDGSRIAFLRNPVLDRIVTISNTDDFKALRIVKIEDKARSIEWADPDHLLITTSITGLPFGYKGAAGEWLQTSVFDVRDGSLKMLPDYGGQNYSVMQLVLGPPDIRHIGGHTVLFLRAVQASDTLDTALVRVDLQTGATHVVQPAHSGILRRWVIDDAGEIAVEETYNIGTRHWSVTMRHGWRSREVASGQDDIGHPLIMGWGPDPDTVMILGREHDDWVWQLLSLKDGAIKSMGEHSDFEVPIWSPLTHRLIGGSYTDDSEQLKFFDTLTRYSWEMVLGAFPGERVELASQSDDFRKFVVRVESPEKGFRFVLVDLDAHRMLPLGDVYPGVKPYPVQRIDYAARDGLAIPAYITLPDRKPASLPLIVLAHGGPEDRDTADFDWWSQALASLGYVVLQANFRGSALDQEFVSRGFGEWGRKMQTDLSDGVRRLVKAGLVDPQRVCIVGASYGGYAALAGAALDPGVYRCAVSVAGIADVRRMLEWDDARARTHDAPEQRYWYRFIGVKSPSDPLLDTISPIKHLDAIKVPILLIHGRDDTVVDYQQSQAMFDALKAAGKEVEFVTLKNEDHWLSRGETRLQMLQATAAFLLVNNPPR